MTSQAAVLLMDARMTISVTILAIAKTIAEETGEISGSFPCPRCHTGTVRWSVASTNGHGRAICDRKWIDETGAEHNCTAIME